MSLSSSFWRALQKRSTEINMICVPIIGKTAADALHDMEKADAAADIIELRLDSMKNPDSRKLAWLLERKKKMAIVTARKFSEGGFRKLSFQERLEIYRGAILHHADFVDIELSSPGLLETLRPSLEQSQTKLIVSFHDFSGTGREKLFSAYAAMKRQFMAGKKKAYALKIISYARSIGDISVILELLERAKKEHVRIIAFCMGPFGEASRALCCSFGSWLTYGALSIEKSTAPGQIEAKLLRDVYCVNQHRHTTPKIYGLVGNPVKQSKGYLLHNGLFRKHHLNAIYVNFLVDNLFEFMGKLGNKISGLSVTIPYKEEIISYLDGIDSHAKSIGAVNTVVRKDGKLRGYNTDWSGAIRALEESISVRGKRALIIGAGGAARAVCYGIIRHGGHAYITNRTFSKARQLAADIGGIPLPLMQISAGKPYDIIINCTSLGMFPKIKQSPLSLNSLRKLSNSGTVAFDTVYNPEYTTFLNHARSLGLTAVSGVSMFRFQAYEQFFLWTRKNQGK